MEEETKLRAYQQKIAAIPKEGRTDYEVIKEIFMKNKLDYLSSKFSLIINGITLAFDAKENLTDIVLSRRL